jgi:hypothetical protein
MRRLRKWKSCSRFCSLRRLALRFRSTQEALSAGSRAVAVAISGLAATTFTGEFEESWLYLLQDLAEAAVGLALGLAIARWVLPRLGVMRAI